MKIKKISITLLIVSILCLAAFIRLQGITNVPSGQLTGSDGYLYYRQAQLISEHGQLPERDMRRWLPLGRDLGQTPQSLQLCPRLRSQSRRVDISKRHTVSCYHLYTCCLLLHRAWGALPLFLPHLWGPFFEHCWRASGDPPRCDRPEHGWLWR